MNGGEIKKYKGKRERLAGPGELRAALRGQLAREPGVTTRQLARAVGVRNERVRREVAHAIEDGEVVVSLEVGRGGTARRFYLPSASPRTGSNEAGEAA